MAKKIQIFGQDVDVPEIKVHAVMINEGLLVTLLVLGDGEDVVYGTTVAREHASFDDVTDMISEATARFNRWSEGQARGPADDTAPSEDAVRAAAFAIAKLRFQRAGFDPVLVNTTDAEEVEDDARAALEADRAVAALSAKRGQGHG